MISNLSLDLPIEIVGQIICLLPHERLKRIRLVCKAYNDFARRELFHTVNLKVNCDSFGRLKQISLDAHLAPCVRKVFYDGSLLPWIYTDFDEYCDDGIGRGYNFSRVSPQGQPLQSRSGALEEFRSYFDESQLEYHHQRYCQRLENQKHLHRGSNEVDLLTAAFKRLPNLSMIEFRSGASEWSENVELCNTTCENPTYALRSSYVGQEALIRPYVTHAPGEDLFGVKRVVALMSAAISANNKITQLAAGVMDLVRMHSKLEILTTLDAKFFLGRLNSLSMDVGDDGPPEAFANILEMASNLENLELRAGKFDENSDRVADLKLSRIMQMRSHWPRLRHLELGMFVVQQTEFIAILHQNSTLTTLTLSDIHVSEGSFVEMLIFLAESMRLRTLHLKGKMVSGLGEQWLINPSSNRYRGCGIASSRPNFCLLHMVERYVLRKGPCPFTRRHEVVDGDEDQGVGMRWVADYDETFRLA